MKKYNRIFVIVLDSLGIGAMPDSERFGRLRCHRHLRVSFYSFDARCWKKDFPE